MTNRKSGTTGDHSRAKDVGDEANIAAGVIGVLIGGFVVTQVSGFATASELQELLVDDTQTRQIDDAGVDGDHADRDDHDDGEDRDALGNLNVTLTKQPSLRKFVTDVADSMQDLETDKHLEQAYLVTLYHGDRV